MNNDVFYEVPNFDLYCLLRETHTDYTNTKAKDTILKLSAQQTTTTKKKDKSV